MSVQAHGGQWALWLATLAVIGAAAAARAPVQAQEAPPTPTQYIATVAIRAALVDASVFQDDSGGPGLQVRGSQVGSDSRGLTVVTDPTPATLTDLFGKRPPDPLRVKSAGLVRSLWIPEGGPVSDPAWPETRLELPWPDQEDASYLTQTGERVKLDERAGYAVQVSLSGGYPALDATIVFGHSAFVGAQFDESQKAFNSRPTLSKTTLTNRTPFAFGQETLLLYQPQGLNGAPASQDSAQTIALLLKADTVGDTRALEAAVQGRLPMIELATKFIELSLRDEALFEFDPARDLPSQIAELLQSSRATIINEPRVTTRNGCPARISFSTHTQAPIGRNAAGAVGRGTGADGTMTVETEQRTTITPTVLPDGASLSINIRTEQLGPFCTVNGADAPPEPLENRPTSRTVVARNGEMVHAGSVIRTETDSAGKQRPVQVMIFVTPTILGSERWWRDHPNGVLPDSAGETGGAQNVPSR